MERERYKLLKKLGYFEVDDSFWADIGMPLFIGEGFNWAFSTPQKKQKYMPYKEQTLINRSDDELKMNAHRNLMEEPPSKPVINIAPRFTCNMDDDVKRILKNIEYSLSTIPSRRLLKCLLLSNAGIFLIAALTLLLVLK